MYDGANLARTANAVVVSVNYRLGVLGFFNLGQLKTGDAARRLGQLRAARHHQGAAVRQSQHRRVRRRSGQRHADGRVGRRGERLRLDDVAAARRCQSGAGAQTAADQRRHFAGRANCPPAASPTLAPASAFRGQADLLLRELLIGDGQAADAAAATALVASKSAGGDRRLHAEQERRCDLDDGRDEAGARSTPAARDRFPTATCCRRIRLPRSGPDAT